MLRFAMGVTRKDKIRNEHIRSTVKVERLGMKMREGRLRWYAHVMRRDQEYVGRKMIEMELPGVVSLHEYTGLLKNNSKYSQKYLAKKQPY